MRKNVITGFIIFLAIALAGIIFFKPAKEYLADLFPDQPSKEERRLVGTVSGRNPRVEEIQKMLKELGFYRGPADGKMGEGTRKALITFQKKNNIDVTGKAGSKTVTELNRQAIARSKNTKPSVERKRVAVDDVSYDIKVVQSLLKKLGYYQGEIDGKAGRKTVKAIKQFQRSENLKENGIIDAETWVELQKYENGR